MTSPLDQITLCTYSTGSTMVREVLEDWIQFLCGKPKKTVFVVSSTGALPPVYNDLENEGVIDEVIEIGLQGRSVHQVDPLAIRTAIEAARTEWVLLVKLDTLPYRVGNETWLKDDMEMVEREGLFGVTGGWRPEDQKPLSNSHSLTQKYSNNFALFRTAEWLEVHDKYLGRDWQGPMTTTPNFQGDSARFATEASVEDYLRKTGRQMLIRHESNEWSVFHVNVWGERLREVREQYIRRVKVDSFLNTGQPVQRKLLYPWEKYYMYPAPSVYRRFRIWFGREWRKLLYTQR